MNARNDMRKQSHSTIILLLVLSAVLPMFFNSAGVIAGAVLALMVFAWLLRASNEDVRNRTVLVVLATLVLLMNGAFMIGVLTDGTWRF